MDDYDAICALLTAQLAQYADRGRPLTAQEAQSILFLVQAKKAAEQGK